jgi:hypothetical protein
MTRTFDPSKERTRKSPAPPNIAACAQEKPRRPLLLADATDCDMIGNLATEPAKRELFRRLAADLRQMVADIDAAIAASGEGRERQARKARDPNEKPLPMGARAGAYAGRLLGGKGEIRGYVSRSTAQGGYFCSSWYGAIVSLPKPERRVCGLAFDECAIPEKARSHARRQTLSSNHFTAKMS